METEKNDNSNGNTNLPTAPTLEVNILKKRKKPYTSSLVWDHFNKVLKTDGTIPDHATCNYCKKLYCCDSKSGTSTLKRHLLMCTRNPHKSSKDPKQKILSTTLDETIVGWKFDQELCRSELARMIIVDELPFNFLAHEGFKSFCKTMQPRFQLVSRTTMRKDCLELYKTEKEKLKELFHSSAQRVCITTDMWTSIQNLGYMCLTAHYIDEDCKLHKKIINFRVVPTPHNGEFIGNALELCLLSWGLEKLNTITVDNFAANDVAIRSLKRKFNKKNGLLLDGEFFHMRCCAHVLNLIVRDGINEIKGSIIRIRNSVKYVKGSPSRLQRFKECVNAEKITSRRSLCLDVLTRWNSTYSMLESALVFQKAFDRLEECDQEFQKELAKCGLPTQEDWNKARMLSKFLEIFYGITKRLSGSKYVTSNIYFHEVYGIEQLLLKWSTSEDISFREIGIKMKSKFDKYWSDSDKENLLMIVAVILDPCYKLGYVKFCYSKLYTRGQADEKIAKVMDVMNRLFQQYQSFSLASSTNTEALNQSTNTSSSGTSTVQVHNSKQEYRKYLREEFGATSKSELECYLDEGGIDGENSNFDILNWWKVNTSKFPILSAMARDIFAIPVSTVASESAFSTGGRVLERFRSSLTPNLVECLLCAEDWLRVSDPPSLEEKLEELEEDDLCYYYYCVSYE